MHFEGLEMHWWPITALMSSAINLLALQQQRPTLAPHLVLKCISERAYSRGISSTPAHFTSSHPGLLKAVSKWRPRVSALPLSLNPSPALLHSNITLCEQEVYTQAQPSNFPLPQHNVHQSQLALNQNSFSNLPHDTLSVHNAVNCEWGT